MNLTEPILRSMGIAELNAMQREMFACGADAVVLLAPTGSGKTVAFLLPVVLALQADPSARALVMAPSRELAQQLERVARSMGTEVSVTCCYGGHAVETERRSLHYAPRLVIGTPGRLLDHLTAGDLEGGSFRTVVFDEFDKLLELGFGETIEGIMTRLSEVKRKILVSATEREEPPGYLGMADAVTLDFRTERPAGALKTLKVNAGADPEETVLDLICALPTDEPILVFSNFRESSERISAYLSAAGIENSCFHGGMEQPRRERELVKFRNGSVNVLVATDLAARGLDIPEIRHVVHYHLPETYDALVHRNGRTARMNGTGTAYLLLPSGEEPQPEYLSGVPETFVPEKGAPLPPVSLWQTLYIGKGKKDKLSAADIVGFLCRTGGVKKEDIGQIEVKDRYAYVAVRRSVAAELVAKVRREKIKKMRTKIALAY